MNVWAQTKVGALTFMDDWGLQESLLIISKYFIRGSGINIGQVTAS